MAETVESPGLLHLDFLPFVDSGESQAAYAAERMTIDGRTEEGWEWVSDERVCAELRSNPVQIVVEKSRLEKNSSYFRALKSFREGASERVQVDCDVLLFIILLKFFYTGILNITPSEVATLLETSVFFGVDEAIDRIETWMTVTSTTNDPELISNVVNALPAIWDTSNRYGQYAVKNFCSRFLAINFISAAAQGAFVDLPCTLLNACLNHPQLTVDSEARLLEALVRWCEAQDLTEEADEEKRERRVQLLDKVRASLLPQKILLARYSLKDLLDYKSRTIRLTSYLKSLDLSGCHEVDEDVLFNSSSRASVPDEIVESDERLASARVEESSSTSSGRVGSQVESILPIRSAKWPIGRSFKALTNVTLSQCNMIPQDALALWLGETCPNLTKLVAVNCPQIELMLLPLLSKGCPQLQTLDISLDTFSLEESDISKTLVHRKAKGFSAKLHFLIWGVYPLRQLSSLSLRGRSELKDRILNNVLINCQALLELDISMCTALSDHGISEALKLLPKGLQSLRARCTKIGPSCCNVLSLSALDLQTLDVESCHGLSAEGISSILELQDSLETLLLGGTSVDDSALLLFKGRRLRELSVRDTKVSANALGPVIRMNEGLRSLDIRGCPNVCTSEVEDNDGSTHSSAGLPHDGRLFEQLGSSNLLEELKVGWRFSYFALEAMEPNQKLLKNFEVGVGGSLCNMCLGKISMHWSSLQKLTLCFQTIDDDGIIEILDGLRGLQVLEVRKNIGYLTSRGIAALVARCPPGLKVLKLDRFAPGMSDDDLLQLSRSCKDLSHFSLVGCSYLTARSLVSITENMRALTELRLEECGGLTTNGGACVLKSCKALERLILRHNGKGLEEDFVMKATHELLHLWYLSLDFCDSVSDRFETPEVVPLEDSLSTVLLSRCHVPESGLVGPVMSDGNAKRNHKDTIVLRWTRDRIHACTIKRRVY
ncbi:hypothetical protein R1sor_015885 [Riccia sorocarpa]|uniref:BTB domain-containing protein n=1 Tax=Riccia sorocarpa TaxID=122646 RepID=A0ABD3HHM5_9MARC